MDRSKKDSSQQARGYSMWRNSGGSTMRRIPLIAAALSLLISGPCFAQEWIEYASQKDFFTVNFPSEPKVEDITYTTEYRITLPGRVYSATDGPNRYTVTVVDYTGAEKIHAERNRQRKATDAYPDICGDRSRGHLRRAIVSATFHFLQRDAKVTFYAWYNADLVEGHRLQLTNADGSR